MAIIKDKDLVQIYQSAVGYELVIRTNSVMDNTTDLLLVIKNDEVRKLKKLSIANITNPANGEVTYISEKEDLLVPGDYYIQLIDVTDDLFIPSEIGQFRVLENI